MNELALFAGAGGGLLASRLLSWRTVCAVEIDKYCQRVLLQRQRDGMLDIFPIWDDVRTFDGNEWRGRVDVVTAGFPCQPFSVAGKRLGEGDERNRWPDTARILGEVRPRFALLENSPALAARKYFGDILRDLAEVGLDARWDCFSAAGVGAPHIRRRLWIFAYAHDTMRPRRREAGRMGWNGWTADAQAIHDAHVRRPAPSQDKVCARRYGTINANWWASEPGLGRVANGVANRVDRLRAIGNGQVPSVVVRAWHELTGDAR